MALYDGFFDAELNTETGKYDREYSAPDFTGYFGTITGSGVCVYENPDSMRVRREAGSAVVEPGYLFLRGYWLKNDGEYSVALPSAGAFRILARLDLSRRMIEIVSQPVAEEVPEDSLVLSVIDVDAGTVTDTREDPELCGVIDAVGDLAQKIEAVLQYIDTEIEQKLREAQEQILAQDARLDAKIVEVAAQVEKITPPPVGTVKFTASQEVGPEWLRCDGSFVNEEDYPELVAALGKLTPGQLEFHEALQGQAGSGLTNCVVWQGGCWVFSLQDNTLYHYKIEQQTVSSIPVSGTDSLTSSITNGVWLSITGGSLFLTQIQGAAKTVVALMCAGFTGAESSLSMTELDVKGAIDSYIAGLSSSSTKPTLPGEFFYPEVCEGDYDWGSAAGGVQKSFLLCLGYRFLSSTTSGRNYYYNNVYYAVWKAGGSPSLTVSKYDFNGNAASAEFLKNGYRFSHKNSGELISLNFESVTTSSQRILLKSEPAGLYTATAGVSEGSGTPFQDDVLSTTCTAGNGRYLYRCFVQDKTLVVRAGKYNPMTMFTSEDAQPALKLPNRAQTFPDSVCYCASQDMWFVFVGTGIAFTATPEQAGTWGYLDTQETLGVISRFGSLDVDETNGILFLSGQDTQNKGRLGVLHLPPLFNYANDGAFLPTIASDGVPAYIKAKEVE